MSFRIAISTSITLLLALLSGACGSSKSDQTKPATAKAPEMPQPPAIMSDPTDRAGFMAVHLFDGVDTLDTDMFANDMDREQWMSDLLGIGSLANEEHQRKAMEIYFDIASPAMDSIALAMSEDYLGHPNSPIFNEGRCILVLEVAKEKSLLDEAEQVRLEERKVLFSRNQVGQAAEDFTYITSDGATHTLYGSFKGNEVLLMFYNPSCENCKKTLDFLSTSSIINKAVAKGLKVLCIYAENDEEEWRNHLDLVPKFATAGHNADGRVWNKSLYDLKAIPTLYLLDKNKHVLLKDVFPQDLENYLSMREKK